MRKKIVAPEGNAAGRDIHLSDAGAPTLEIHSISGGTNIIGNTGSIRLQVERTISRPKIVVQPGPQHISEAQKAALKALCEEWVALHLAIKKTALSYSRAWSRLNAAAGTTSYSLILKERLPDAIAFIRQEIGKLRNMRSAPTKDDQWRTKRIGAIKARCKNQLRDVEFYKAYIKKNFKAESLSDLATDELQRTYSYIMAKKLLL